MVPSAAIAPVSVSVHGLVATKVTVLLVTDPPVMVKQSAQIDVPVMVPTPAWVRIRVSG